MCVFMWGEIQGKSPQSVCVAISNRYTPNQSPSQHDSLPHPRASRRHVETQAVNTLACSRNLPLP